MKNAPPKKPPRRENDSSYRNLFNHADMIEHLLRRYGGKDWVERLDFSTLESVKASFVGRENQHRESDVIWRLKFRESQGWFPHFRYLVLDEGHMSEEQLGPVDNPVTAIFRIEQAQTIEDLREVIPKIVRMLSSSGAQELRKDMLSWLRRVIFPVKFPDNSGKELRELMEDVEMIAERIQEWPQQWLAEGRQEGLEEGRQEGRRLELLAMLQDLLEDKFGPEFLPYRESLSQASVEQLRGWTKKILSAETLHDIFGE